MNPKIILYAVVAFSWVEFLFSAYLGFRQRKIYKKHETLPPILKGIMDEKTFHKARLYALDKSTFGTIQGTFSQIVSTFVMIFWAYKYIWQWAGMVNVSLGFGLEDEIWRSIWFMVILNIFSTIIALPFSVYSTFVLEEKHGFNKQTPLFFIKDQIKAFVVGQVIGVPLITAIIKIIQFGGDYFFVGLWLFVFIFSLFMMFLYPEFIAPLFDKYTPLPEGELRTKIEDLASSINFPLYKLFVVEGSKRSTHSNAYMYGFYKFKRIVLFDTLLEESEREKLKTEEDKMKELEEKEEKEKKMKEAGSGDASAEEEETKEKEKSLGCSTPEILAVLGHELGHWKLNHVLKMMSVMQLNMFLLFALFGYLYKNPILYEAFGFYNERPILIGLMIIVSFITAPYNSTLEFFLTLLTRHGEFQADEFSTNMGYGEDLKTALVKLNNDNLGFPIYDWLYSTVNHSHPPLLERMAYIDELMKKPK